MELLAPAKINLYLEIINKRKDGYHNLESIMHKIDLCDKLEFFPSDKIELICDNSICPVEKNLVYKVAQKLKENFNVNTGVKIILKKYIPTGAGLGGGSSDAATTIIALNKIWNLNLTTKHMQQIAATIGSDVAFFITGTTAKVEGVGDIITEIRTKQKYKFILVKPKFGVPTANAYSKIKFPLTNSHKINKIIDVIENDVLTKSLAKNLFYNRFEESVFIDYPEIKDIKATLENMGVVSLMSGSGATVFGLVSDDIEANLVLDKLKKYSWNVWLVGSFDRQY